MDEDEEDDDDDDEGEDEHEEMAVVLGGKRAVGEDEEGVAWGEGERRGVHCRPMKTPCDRMHSACLATLKPTNGTCMARIDPRM